MSVKNRLREDMKQAMRSGDKARLGVIRMALAAIQQREVDERVELDDTAVLGVIEKMIKQRRESIEQYRAGRRDDLADREAAEIDVLSGYLPEPLSAAELDALIRSTIEKTGATSMKDMGRVMAELRTEAQGRADMAVLSARVKAILAG
ncbi:GatB/YqeY domain-containing protein [Wenzhouxiangella sp. XN24]|uniref:GatB/YqeY domain-containing protein n=1 Tax=Wenzhouxiangella sp. XN24 TaxID=2713569 RepID=UPI0013EB3D51|nr:GatB/YqeY domain-containing protein [Wenzhouxiangella sp. XN24]NGX16119.1 GatB/YqeY domain-containing protein [Wenzhouxiangella sp. XN24]